MQSDLLWHPFTQEKTKGKQIHIERGEGTKIFDTDGKSYLDMISSWWVNLHGHANLEIADAIYRQAKKLEHVIFAGFTHTPAVELCTELSKFLPESLVKFFFSDNGSTSVEVALKMAYQFWFNVGERNRTIFLCFEGAYHGDTFGAMSVSAIPKFHDVFKELFFKSVAIPFPNTWDYDDAAEEKEQNALRVLEECLESYGNQVAAFIMEPIIQGASGMKYSQPSFVKKVCELLKNYGILLIFDEVMTGFYRTGKMFALEHVCIAPDIICLSKGLTGGFLPLALTVTTKRIYDAFLGDGFNKALAHGHSYTANPIACAAAIASTGLLSRDETIKNINKIVSIQKENLEKLYSMFSSVIMRPRCLGTIAAFDLDDKSYNVKDISLKLLNMGVFIRPLGNTVYLLPPYCISQDELVYSYRAIEDCLTIAL